MNAQIHRKSPGNFTIAASFGVVVYSPTAKLSEDRAPYADVTGRLLGLDVARGIDCRPQWRFPLRVTRASRDPLSDSSRGVSVLMCLSLLGTCGSRLLCVHLDTVGDEIVTVL